MTKPTEAGARQGMDFWWNKWIDDEQPIPANQLPQPQAMTPVMYAIDFAQWFAQHCAEAGEQYFGHAGHTQPGDVQVPDGGVAPANQQYFCSMHGGTGSYHNCVVCQQNVANPGSEAAPLPDAEPGSAEALARLFHETYERLAPQFGYETKKDSAVPWEKVPEKNRRLMIAVCAEIVKSQARDWLHENAAKVGLEKELEEAREALKILRELDFANVQPPYDHDGECSYCGTKEGYGHPLTCSWVRAEAALHRSDGKEGR